MRKELKKMSRFNTANVAYAYRNEGCPQGKVNFQCKFDEKSEKLFKLSRNQGCTTRTLDFSCVIANVVC